MERAQKKELVSSLNEIFTSAGVIVVSRYNGLTVAEMTDLRNKMREAGASLKVTKNRLTRFALEGTDVESIVGLFKGPTVIGYSDDPVAAPKVLNAFAKENDKLEILGGAMGTTELDVATVKYLASLPSLDALRGKLIGCISAPAQKVAAVTAAPAGQLARVFGAYGATNAA